MEIHGHVTAVRQVADGDETTSALLAADTVIPVSSIVDFDSAGGHVRIDGEVYAYSAIDTGEESGVVSITLDTGLVGDVADETPVEVWDTSTGTVVADWKVDVTDDLDGTPRVATLTHTLIPLMAEGMPTLVGRSVTAQADSAGALWVTEVHGGIPGMDPGFIRTGGLGADTVVWAGEENGRRAQLDGIEGALECYNDANEQTVNLDGDANYIEGTLATARDGDRIEFGRGETPSGPTNEGRFYTGSGDEVTPGKVSVDILGGIFGRLVLSSPEFQEFVAAALTLRSGTASGGTGTFASLSADEIQISASTVVTVLGALAATMGAGSVGSGTFRDDVRAQVAPTLATFGHIERDVDNTQTITSGAAAATILWQSSAVAGRGGVSYSAGVYTLTTAGTYTISVYIAFGINATGRRQVTLRRNGVAEAIINQPASPAGVWSTAFSTTFDCAASDTIDVLAFQDSGANLALPFGTLTIHRVA